METTLTVVQTKNLEISKKLNSSVWKVVGENALIGFEKAYMVASATEELKQLLNADYMKPIMALQGNRLGFKTDKDKDGGYPENVVKNCLIEAVLMGVQPYGNEFNIIAGNCYLTKEGIGSLLKRIEGLQYDIVHELPRINQTNTSAAVTAKITWNYKGVKGEKSIEIPVKMNSFMGADAVLGKATRKARKWLYDTITGSDIPEGDVIDLDKSSYSIEKVDKEADRIIDFINKTNDLDALLEAKDKIKPEQMDLFNQKVDQLTSK